MATLFKAQLDGIELDIEGTDDSFPKAIVRHEFPHTDGALLEDMGMSAREIRFRCYFWDDGPNQTYDTHLGLLESLKSGNLSELIHPQYGPLSGMVEQVSVRADDRERTAEIDITFVVNLTGETAAPPAGDVAALTEDTFVVCQEQQADEIAADLKTITPAGVYLELQGELIAAVNASGLPAAATFAAGIVAEVNDSLAYFGSLASQVDQPVNSLVASISYATTVPGRILGTVTRSVERAALLYTTLTGSPARFSRSLTTGLGELVAAFEDFTPPATKGGKACRAVLVKQLRIACAQRLALDMAGLYGADEDNRRQVRSAEQTTSFDVAGRYLPAATMPPVMNARELEESLADARQLLQQSIDQARSLEGLKTMAATLLDHVSSVKLEREKIFSMQVDRPLPLHLLCHMQGLPYNYAERVHSINKGLIKNPTFVAGEVQIYAR